MDKTADLKDVSQLLANAQLRREELGLPYAGALTPPEAWELMKSGHAKLVDVRTPAEVKYVGSVPGAVLAEWRGADPQPGASFAAALGSVASPDDCLLLMCRSAGRSHSAATAAAAAGYKHVYNVLEGFEGQRNAAQRRGEIDGWRKHGLPWIQD